MTGPGFAWLRIQRCLLHSADCRCRDCN